jgi:hypothetical protein
LCEVPEQSFKSHRLVQKLTPTSIRTAPTSRQPELVHVPRHAKGEGWEKGRSTYLPADVGHPGREFARKRAYIGDPKSCCDAGYAGRKCAGKCPGERTGSYTAGAAQADCGGIQCIQAGRRQRSRVRAFTNKLQARIVHAVANNLKVRIVCTVRTVTNIVAGNSLQARVVRIVTNTIAGNLEARVIRTKECRSAHHRFHRGELHHGDQASDPAYYPRLDFAV